MRFDESLPRVQPNAIDDEYAFSGKVCPECGSPVPSVVRWDPVYSEYVVGCRDCGHAAAHKDRRRAWELFAPVPEPTDPEDPLFKRRREYTLEVIRDERRTGEAT